VINSPFRNNRVRECNHVFGFGFDENTNDYVIVALSNYDPYDLESVPSATITHLNFYSVKTTTWRRIANVRNEYSLDMVESGVFVNGAIHWLLTNKVDDTKAIYAFKVATNDATVMPTSNDVDHLLAHRGTLCKVVETKGYGIEVWQLNRDGGAESWQLLFNVKHEGAFASLKPVLPLATEESIVLEKDFYNLVVYHWRDKRFEDLVVDHGVNDIGDFYAYVGNYVESRVSPGVAE
jgi:F-box interacting protein